VSKTWFTFRNELSAVEASFRPGGRSP